MTKIEINTNENEFELIVDGHSGYAEYGKDIVCASISTLTFTWINQIREFERQNLAKVTQFDMEDGKILLKFETSKSEVLSAFETIINGFLMLEENFFQNLHVNRGEFKK